MEILSTCAARVFQSRHNENSIMCNAKRWTLQRRGVRVLLVVWTKIVKDVKITQKLTVFPGAGSWATDKVRRWGWHWVFRGKRRQNYGLPFAHRWHWLRGWLNYDQDFSNRVLNPNLAPEGVGRGPVTWPGPRAFDRS